MSAESSAGNRTAAAAKWRRAASSVSIFGIAFTLRIIYLLDLRTDPLRDDATFPWHVWAMYDSAYYHQVAVSISQGEWLGPTAFYLSPLYCYFMGLVYAVFGVDLEWVRIAQALLGASSCVLLYWIGRQTFSEITGILSGLTLGVYGLHIYYTGMILPTVLVVFLNLLFLQLAMRVQRAPGIGRSAAAGLVLGLATAVKPNAILLLPVALLAYWLVWRRSSKGSIRGCGVALVAGTLLSIAPFTLHNYLASGHVVLVTTTAGRNLLKGNGPNANGTYVELPEHLNGTPLSTYLKGKANPSTTVAESAALSLETWRHVKSHPLGSLKLLVKKGLLFFNHRELFIRDNFYFARRYSTLLSLPLPGFGLVGALGLTGAILGWRRWRASLLVYAVLLAQLASYTLLFVLARYRLVAVCCLILFASNLVIDVGGQLRRRNLRALIVTTCALIGSAAVVSISFPEFKFDRGFDRQKRKAYQIIRYKQRRAATPELLEDGVPDR